MRTQCRPVVKIKPTDFCVRILAAFLISCFLASCASLIGPRQVELPLSRLQEELDRSFPVNNRLLGVFNIHLSRPQMVVFPETNRVALTLDVSVARPLAMQPWNGRLEMSGQLFADAARGAILIRDIRVNRLALDGLDESLQRQIANTASLMTEKSVRDIPLYSFRPEDLQRGGVQFAPSSIKATPTAFVLTFEPVR